MKTKNEILTEYRNTMPCGDKEGKYNIGDCFLVRADEDEYEDEDYEPRYAIITSNFFAPNNYEVVMNDDSVPFYLTEEEIDENIEAGEYVMVKE